VEYSHLVIALPDDERKMSYQSITVTFPNQPQKVPSVAHDVTRDANGLNSRAITIIDSGQRKSFHIFTVPNEGGPALPDLPVTGRAVSEVTQSFAEFEALKKARLDHDEKELRSQYEGEEVRGGGARSK
jgi:hypothetical protein